MKFSQSKLANNQFVFCTIQSIVHFWQYSIPHQLRFETCFLVHLITRVIIVNILKEF